MVQSILIGFDFDEAVLRYIEKRKLIEEKTVRLIRYKTDEDKLNITLKEIEYVKI